MVALATKDDLADWIGEPIDSDANIKRAELCLRIASALVRGEANRRWDSGDVPEAAHLVTLYCASRVYENREAETQFGVDDVQSSRKVLESGAHLTASEKRMLFQLNQPQHRGLGTIATTKQERLHPNGWVPTDTEDVQFPWY